MISGLEFLIAWLSNVKIVCFAGTFLGVLALVMLAISRVVYKEDGGLSAEAPLFTRSMWAGAIVTVLFALLAALPDPEDLWRVRIAFIKMQLASPENVEKAVDHIDTLGKELECRYLGHCPKDESARK